MKRFKNCNEQPVNWRSRYARHKDVSSARVLRFGNWPRLAGQTKEQCETLTPEPQYPRELLKSFNEAIRRCPTISISNDVMDGQPCISNTRIPVRAVLRAMEQYGSIEEVRRCYPHLTKTQVEDALYFSQIVLELPGALDETTPAS